MSDRQADRNRQDADRIVLSVPEAAERLGLTPDAIRARLHRGTLDGEKQAGQWRVFLAAEPEAFRTESVRNDTEPVAPTGSRQDATGDRQDADSRAFAERYAQLERENERLWAELEARSEEIRRRDHIIAGLVERLPALPATAAPDAFATRVDGPGRAKPTTAAADASSPDRSFWCWIRWWWRGSPPSR